jgi:hypothetical protein
VTGLEGTRFTIREEPVDRCPHNPILLVPACKLGCARQRAYHDPSVMADPHLRVCAFDGIYVFRDNCVYREALVVSSLSRTDEEDFAKTKLLTPLARLKSATCNPSWQADAGNKRVAIFSLI